MAGFMRHVWALTRKNFVNWHRTWFGSILEILLPLLCMYLVTIPYNMGTQKSQDMQQYLELAYAQYPVTNPVGIRWIPTLHQPTELYQFLEFANITKQPSDFFRYNPGYFYPEHCYGYGTNNPNYTKQFSQSNQTPRRNFTAIGFIANNNQIERDVLSQLQIMFQQQQQLLPGVYFNYTFKKFNTQEEVNNYVKDPEYTFDPSKPGLCFAFQIKKLSDTRFDVSLMFNDQFDSDPAGAGIPRQANAVWDPINPLANIPAFNKYMNSGYSIMQNLIANTLLRSLTVQNASIAMITVPQNQQPFQTNPLIKEVLVTWLPLATLAAYLFPVFRVSQRMVAEKETQVRDSMRMMGLNEIAYWTSWLLYYLVINTLVASMCTLMLFLTLFAYSTPFVLWLFFFMYGLSLFGFVTLVQAFFQNARYSAYFAAVLYGACYLVNLLVQSGDISQSNKNWGSLIPQVALALMVPHLGAFEAAGIGLHFSNISTPYQNYNFAVGYWMLLLDFVIYTLIGVYIDNVYPRESGMQKPLSYGFSYLKASYWDFFDLCYCKRRNSAKKYLFHRDAARRKAELEDHDFLNFETKYMQQENFEAPDIALQSLERKRRFLKISDLRKHYSNGLKAVDGINLRMYEGQIFALLGHNGAGKTTTIQMMIGMLEPTDGEAFVYGYRVFSQGDMDSLRKYMGVCPQHNVLFDLLTPLETIKVFQDFKGAIGTAQEKLAEVEKLLKDVGLWEFRTTLGKNLSGGNKRKLSVAIALCGNSKFVMLDEPTAGMDLQARRNLWNMLRAYRNDRIIVLTTHYMDEADVLGDRIAIMQNGRLVTVGSSLFLKKRYGVGYNFCLTKSNQFDIAHVDAYLKQQLSPQVTLVSDIGDEVTYKVPTECSSVFRDFFNSFDLQLAELGIKGYGISVTSLEEVFLRVGSEDSTIPPLKPVNPVEKVEQNQFTVAELSHGSNVGFNLKALCFKRLRLERRRWKSVLFTECLAPVFIVLLGVWITQIRFFFDSPPRHLQTKLLPLQQRVLMNAEPVERSQLPNETLVDSISIPALVSNLPSSYTLLTDDDFSVLYQNYTDDYVQAQIQKANGTLANQTFDYFSSFNEDVYVMRNYQDAVPYRFGSYLIYQADPVKFQYKVISFVNTTSQDVAALYPQFMYEAILRSASNNSNFQFKMTSRPFPISQFYHDQEQQSAATNLIFVVAIGLSMIPANIVSAILRERISNLKHLQLISGLNLVVYHLVNMVFDILKAQVIVLTCAAMFFIWGLKDYYWSLLLLCLWPIAVIPATHAAAFLFQTEWSAQFFVIGINFTVLGLLPFLISQLQFNIKTLDIADSLNSGFLMLPGYGLSRALLFGGYNKTITRFRLSIGQLDYSKEVWSPGNFTYNIASVFIQCAVFVVLVLLFEFFNSHKHTIHCCQKVLASVTNKFVRQHQIISEHVDEDVINEAKSVEHNVNSSLQVRVLNLSKTYQTGLKRVTAVHNTSFGLDFGECFALLGVNGAGKTTTFKSLTNEIQPTSGTVQIGGFDVVNQFTKARKLIGFCPQENVLFEQLTVEEHLQFYGLLKGIPSKVRRDLIESTILEMDLAEQRKKLSRALSGGNKRKLQVAIAIIGNPSIVLLDEPSAGMDPQARRFMWSVIAQLNKRRQKCAVILSTHSMEEAEALGTKLGIMVRGGQFRCFGSAQHLKSKFGTGFEVEIKIKPLEAAGLQHLLQLFRISEFLTKMPLQDAVQRMRQSNFPEELLEEIRPYGLGDELVRESKFDATGNVRIKHLMEWVHNMKYGMRVVRTFAKDFGQVTLLEQYSDYFKIRFPMQDKSIGFVFGVMEEKKDAFGIFEYSVSQTTLEQIFQMFANSKRADEENVEDLQKITFTYTPATETSLFELIVTKNI